jgi:S-adenosylmethionine hydrolase
LKKIELNEAKIDSGQSMITGEIMGRDHFGNLQTNIKKSSLNDLYGNEKARVKITVREKIIVGIQNSYTNKSPDGILAIVGSRGVLEIAANRGNAAKLLDAGIGDAVTVCIPKTSKHSSSGKENEG